MTEITLGKVERDLELTAIFSRFFLIVLMISALTCAGSLLKWAVSQKLAQTEIVEASAITAAVRDRQLQCLAKNIYHEAGGEPFEGKVAVAQVTMNRTQSGQFPEDVCKTIYQKNVVYEKVVCQFSWVCEHTTGVRPINRAVYEESMAVAKKVLLEGFRLPSLKDAMYFHGDYINPGWKRERIAHIGRHIFYK
jgi:spore germination cell wall hydrolase CwlJ-like protein